MRESYPHLPVWMSVFGGVLMALHDRVGSHLRTLKPLKTPASKAGIAVAWIR